MTFNDLQKIIQSQSILRQIKTTSTAEFRLTVIDVTTS